MKTERQTDMKTERQTDMETDITVKLSITNKPLIIKKMAIITDYIGLDIVLFLTLIISALYLFLTRNFNHWKKKGIPYLKPTPFFGNLKDIILQKQHIGEYLRTAYEKTSGEPYFGLFAIDKPVIVAKDIDVIKNILVKDFDKFSDRSLSPVESVDPLSAKNLFGQKGLKWRHLRVKMTPTFTSGKLKKMFYLVDECAQKLTEIIEQESITNKPLIIKKMAIITDYIGLDIVLFLTLIISALYLFLTRNFNHWKKKGIPYLKPTPFFGNLKDIILQKQHIGEYLRTAYEKTSGEPYFGLFAIDKPVIVAKDIDVIKNILVKDFDKFSDRSLSPVESVDPLSAKNLFGQKGLKWRHLRVKMTPTFTSGKLKKMFYLVDECAQKLTEIIEQESVKGKPILVKETMARFTTDVIASCAFGVKSNAMTDPNSEFRKILRRIFELDVISSIKMALAFFVPSIVQTFKLKLLDETVATFVRKTLWDNVEYREKNGIVRHDFVDLLMQLRNSGEVIDDKENDHDIKENYSLTNENNKAFVFLAAGFETSSTTTTYALYELALDLDIQNKLRHEIITVLEKHDRKVTYDAMMEMNYLDMVVSELEGDDFVAQAFVFLAAGFETSSTTTTYALYELALDLDIQNKLRHEIITVLEKHDRKVTYDAMMEMNYLDMVVSETLRKYPALPFLDRSAQVDYKIPGTNDILEKGTTVFIPTFGIHYDPKYYPNPEKFDPERFSAKNKNDIPKYANLPFGEGPRNCIGMRFGLMQVKTGLIHLLSKFEVNRHKETPVPVAFVTSSPTLCPVGDMPLIFNKIRG
uniref:Cytochrome P450 n=1 Tax=Timema tahoe TaxID=61484 RepID=A0A7R9IPY8_9NEOP|nr:unnamed protein product [Timema tahoe]